MEWMWGVSVRTGTLAQAVGEVVFHVLTWGKWERSRFEAGV